MRFYMFNGNFWDDIFRNLLNTFSISGNAKIDIWTIWTLLAFDQPNIDSLSIILTKKNSPY